MRGVSRSLSVGDRIWPLVSKGDPSGCWLWMGYKVGGYGSIRVGGRNRRVHRLVYELLVGPIPVGLLVCHHCDTPACCNPAHLFLGTQKANMQDASAKGRTTRQEFCGRGHRMAGANLRVRFRPDQNKWARDCRDCRRVREWIRRAA